MQQPSNATRAVVRMSRHGGAASAPARLDAVEIKITVTAGQVDHVRSELGLREGRGREVYFCEDLGLGTSIGLGTTGGRVALRLLDAGVVLRLRQTQGRPDEVTAKLRPLRRSQLAPDWLAFTAEGDDELRIEADWAGERRVLAASLETKHDGGWLAQALRDDRPVRHLFSPRHIRFLHECADPDIDFTALSVLGPIRATRWPRTPVTGFEVAAERWLLPGTSDPATDFLELSIRVEPEGAEIAAAGFEAAMEQRGVVIDTDQETKTRRVLEILARTREPLR
ncbi:MAG: hypothetical protein ACRDTA_25540 [Pseudonocardiaceae bacterium]